MSESTLITKPVADACAATGSKYQRRWHAARELFRKDREYLRDKEAPGLIYIVDSEERRMIKSLQNSYERAAAKSKQKRPN